MFAWPSCASATPSAALATARCTRPPRSSVSAAIESAYVSAIGPSALASSSTRDERPALFVPFEDAQGSRSSGQLRPRGVLGGEGGGDDSLEQRFPPSTSPASTSDRPST